MKVYVLEIDPNDYSNYPYTYGIYSTREKAEDVVRILAVEAGEPALLLMKDFDTNEMADCWHYPNYEYQRYYISEWSVE